MLSLPCLVGKGILHNVASFPTSRSALCLFAPLFEDAEAQVLFLIITKRFFRRGRTVPHIFRRRHVCFSCYNDFIPLDCVLVSTFRYV